MNTVGPYHNRYLININSIFIITILILISSMDDTAIYVSIPQTRNIWLLYFALLPGDEGGDIPLSRDHRRGTSGEEFSLFYTFVFLYFCISVFLCRALSLSSLALLSSSEWTPPRPLTARFQSWKIPFHSRPQVNLDPGVLKTFLYAVKNHYWYQMYLDDLPIWGIVGEIDEKGEDFYIWTHKKFEIGWNGDQIVDVNLTSEGRTKLHLSTEKLEFTYEVAPFPTFSLVNFLVPGCLEEV